MHRKEIKPVDPKGNQPWIFIGRTDTEVEPPILWPPGLKSQLIGKDPDAGKDWRQKEKGMTEGEMHPQLNGREFEQLQEKEEDRGSRRAAVPRVTQSQTGLGNWTSTMHLRVSYRERKARAWAELAIHSPKAHPTPQITMSGLGGHAAWVCLASSAPGQTLPRGSHSVSWKPPIGQHPALWPAGQGEAPGRVDSG